jgi:hypothetical protein
MRFVGSLVATTRSLPTLQSEVEEGRTKYGSTRQCQARKLPLKLAPEQVGAGIGTLDFRDQLVVSLDAGLGTRRGALDALRWINCDFNNQVFDVQHSYHWRREGHLVGTNSEASPQPLPVLKDGLLEWRSNSSPDSAGFTHGHN